jgi:two-component system, NarL family, sensor kinase
LTAALQRSRERLVLAREEERRRLRSDLHDSLGPELAGITMGLEATENLLATDLAAATEALGSLRERARQAVGTVRSVVDGLRPPTLDDLGLAESVRRRAASLHGDRWPPSR